MSSEPSHGSTLFVSNLPYDATSTDLQTAFSDLAPVRSAFVVLEHGSGMSKGVGYVSFAIREDAQTVLDSITTNGMTLNGRNLRVQWAESKPKNKARPASVKKEKEPVPRVPRKTSDPLAIRTIVVSGLPTSINQKTLWKKFRKLEGAESVEWPVNTAAGDDPSAAHVLFISSSLAQDAVDKLHAHVFKGSLLSATLKKRLDSLAKTTLKKTASGTTPSRASRLIVRNLPFDVTEQDLRAIFLPYGPIYSIHIPLADSHSTKTEDDPNASKPARSKGFAFVWMLSKKDAEAALEKCNGVKVVAGMANDIVSDKQKRKKQLREEKKRQGIKTEHGETLEELEEVDNKEKERVIAVDWALSKERWEKERGRLEEVVDGANDDVEMDDAGDASTDHDSEGDSGEQIHDEEDSADEDEDEGGDEDEDGPLERDSDDESPQKPQLPHTDTGNTLFIRNVPFNATEDEIRALFRAFGPLRYVRLTIDQETERPRGTGFACFWNKEDADKVIQQSDILRAETTGTQTQPPKNPFSLPSLLTPDPSASVAQNLVLHGRTLDVVRAVTREQAAQLQQDGEKRREKADKRNLYLLREGVILPNSPAAESLSAAELEKRTNAFNARRTLLRTNPSLYVSKTRLSIRQIPLFATEHVLKRLAIHAVRAFEAEVKQGVREALSADELAEAEPVAADADADADGIKEEEDGPSTSTSKSRKRAKLGAKPALLKQAKIVRQSDRVDAVTGKGRSRGYGFLELHTHGDALRVLRWANNNPNVVPLMDGWWQKELGELVKREKAQESVDETRVKRLEGAMTTKGAGGSAKGGKGTLIVEFSIENVQVVKRRAEQKEKGKRPQSHPRAPHREHDDRPRKRASSSTEGPPSKKRHVSDGGKEKKPFENLQVKEESKPGKTLGSIIGRKRRARKAGKRTG